MRIVGCFLEYDDKFVILLRHAHKPNGNTWGLPAGKVEKNENDKEAVLRELEEETGFQGSMQQIEHLGDYDFGSNNDQYTFAAYRLKINKPYQIVVEDVAHADYKWVTAKECYAIPNLIDDFHDLLKLLGYVT